MNPHDPCFCESGKTYKQCHRPLQRASPDRFLAEARKFYVNRWVVNARSHDRANHYEWMAAQVPGPAARILDIGVGEGSGLAALLARFKPDRAITIEENPECVRRARTRLTAAGANVDVVKRMSAVQVAKGSAEYDLEFERASISADGQVTIVITDPLFDDELADDLDAVGPFDLVTVWLMGSHEAREHSRDLMDEGEMSSARYRLLVQNVAYELAGELLVVGGRLQIVDRLQSQDLESIRAALLHSHSEQATPTSLEVTDIEFLPYEEAGANGVKMLLNDAGQGTPVGDTADMLLVSVISIKR